MDIYLLQGGEQTGPFTIEEIRGHIANGALPDDIPAWHEGMETWAPVNELIPAVEESAPAPEPAVKVSPAQPKDSFSVTIPKRLFVWLGYACVGLVLFFAIYYVASPYLALHALKSAIVSGDRDALESHIDFPALRQSLKEEMKAQMTKNMAHDTGMFSGLAQMMAPSIIDNQIDSYVTPAGLSNFTDPIKKGVEAARANPADGSAAPPETDPFQVTKAGFDSPTDFVFTILQSKVHMHYYGLGWKVYSLEMPDYSTIASKVAPSSSPTPTATQDLTSPEPEAPSPYSEEFRNDIEQQARKIGMAMFAYSVDHNGSYPDGDSSTEIFQKLIDGKYADDLEMFYFPMDGKSKPTGTKLSPTNVCFDVTTGATSASPDSLPLVYSTGYVISFQAGDNALAIDRLKVPWSGLGVFTKGNEANFIRADDSGIVANLIPAEFNPDKTVYRQVTPDRTPLPAPQYAALDKKNGFQKFTLGMAQSSLDPTDVDDGYATSDGYCYGVKQFDKQIGSAEIKDVRLYFSEGLLKEIWVSVAGEPNKVGLKEALIAAYGQPQTLSDFGGSYPVWAGAHTQLKLTGFLGDDTTAIFSSSAVTLQIKAVMEKKAQQGAAQGAKNL